MPARFAEVGADALCCVKRLGNPFRPTPTVRDDLLSSFFRVINAY